MADERQSQEMQVPPRDPGVLVGVEWTKQGTVKLTDDQANAVKDLLNKLAMRDQAPRREEITRVWEKRLFDRGFQHILPVWNGAWQLAGQGTGYGYGEEGDQSKYETNIYNSYSEIIISALTREIPATRFRSRKPDDDSGITAARSADCLRTQIYKNNKMLDLMADLARYLSLDGRMVAHTYYMRDGQRFGYRPAPPAVVPEDEEQISEQETGEEGAQGALELNPEEKGPQQSGGAEADIPAGERDGENLSAGGDAGGDASAQSPEETGEETEEEKEPNGREVIEFGGALEWKLPIRKNCLPECGYALRYKEIDVHEARARFPDKASKITPGRGGPGGDDIDRLARVNVDQGMMNSFNTQDSQANDVTWVRAWLRPWQLLELNQEFRDQIIKMFPKGLYVNFCGDVYCEARDQSMDDCLTLIHGRRGDGMHRAGLLDWLLPIQKVLNNWLELVNDYFVRGIPATWMDNETFNIEAVNGQANEVGQRHPFQSPGGTNVTPQQPIEQLVWQETPPPFPEELRPFVQFFTGELAQMLSGAYPALFGGDETSDTVGGQIIQRDQALGRVGLPWRAIKEGIASIMFQAVQCLAQNHDEPIAVIGKVSTTIEMDDLKGEMLAYADVDESFPETDTQKANRLTNLMQAAETNPFLGTIMDEPDNLELVRDANGMEDFVIPQLEARDKQLGEIEVMLKTGPIPNPAIAQIQQQIATLKSAAQKVMLGAPQLAAPEAAQGVQQKIQQLTQQMQQVMQTQPEVSSEPVYDTDDHDVEALTAKRFINSARGRAMRHGSEPEQRSLQNIILHYRAHKQEAAAEAAANQPPQQQKPPSISGNIKDMTPDEQSQALAKAGIHSDPASIAQERATKLAAEHPKEQVPVVQ
jgi:hypothetical protein